MINDQQEWSEGGEGWVSNELLAEGWLIKKYNKKGKFKFLLTFSKYFFFTFATYLFCVNGHQCTIFILVPLQASSIASCSRRRGTCSSPPSTPPTTWWPTPSTLRTILGTSWKYTSRWCIVKDMFLKSPCQPVHLFIIRHQVSNEKRKKEVVWLASDSLPAGWKMRNPPGRWAATYDWH